jgi:hypothetical protein
MQLWSELVIERRHRGPARAPARKCRRRRTRSVRCRSIRRGRSDVPQVELVHAGDRDLAANCRQAGSAQSACMLLSARLSGCVEVDFQITDQSLAILPWQDILASVDA